MFRAVPPFNNREPQSNLGLLIVVPGTTNLREHRLLRFHDLSSEHRAIIARPGVNRRVAVSFGPQYGPGTAIQVDECIRAAHHR